MRLDRNVFPCSPIEDSDAPLAPTSPRVRGEVDLRAHLREASRVRGRFDGLRLAETPPHPDSFASQALRSESDLSPHAGRGRSKWHGLVLCRAHEVEVAALVGAEHVLGVQAGIAAAR